MAVGDISIFENFKLNQHNGVDVVDFDTDTLKVMLVKSTYTPNLAAHNFISDINANEVIAGSSYLAGGPVMAGATLSLIGGNAVFDANDIVVDMDASGFTDAFYIIFYKDTGLAATSRVVAMGEFGADKGVQAGALTMSWNANGILSF